MRNLPNINTLVVKIGSSIITDSSDGLSCDFLSRLADTINSVKNKVNKVVIVSSGAIAAGFKYLQFKEKPKDIIDKQACASVGQARLVWQYEKAFKEYGINVGQILITKDDFSNRRRYLNARSTIRRLLELDVVPIINENDTVVVHELKYVESFGDNDNLSALVAGLIEADLVLILSDVDGLYDKNPSDHNDASLISEVKFFNKDLLNSAGDSVSGVGTGGMRSKILAAKKALDSGCYVGIINGRSPENISRFLDGEIVGTFFSHVEDPISRRKFWMAYAAIPKGELTIDNGAVNAVIKNKKSLLPSGVFEVSGKFGIGDIVKIINLDGIEIGRGKARYSSTDMKKIAGKKSSEIYGILGYRFSDEVIHRDDLAVNKHFFEEVNDEYI